MCHSSRGFSLVQVLIGAALIGGLAVAIAQMMGNLNRSGAQAQFSQETALHVDELSSMLGSGRAMNFTANAPLNVQLKSCLNPPGCSGVFPIEIRDATNTVVLNLSNTAQVFRGKWTALVMAQPLCPSPAACVPDEIRMTIDMNANNAGSGKWVLKERKISVNIKKAMLVSATMSCSAGEVVNGFNADGTPSCMDLASNPTFLEQACTTFGGTFVPANNKCRFKGTVQDNYESSLTGGVCQIPNSATGACSCPPGTKHHNLGCAVEPGGAGNGSCFNICTYN